MSRVSEAMRRAGYQQPEHLVSGSDDAFKSTGHAGDTSAGDPSEYSGLHSAEAPQTHVPHAAPTEAAPTEAAGTSVVDDVRIHDVLRILYRRRWVIATVIILSLAAGAAYNYSALRIYQARARVLIEPTAEEVVPFRSATGEDVGRFDYFLTQLDVLRSQALARETLRRTNRLSTDPTAQAAEVNEFLYGLTVTTSKTEAGESRVVNIAYQSTNPRLAAQMANALAQAYVDQNLELRRQGSLQAAKWLNQRVDELRKEVSATESALQRYREQKDAVSLDSGQNVVVQKFAQLNGAYTSARTDRVQKQTL